MASNETVGAGPSGSPPPNYLWQAIAVTVCCCIPLGIPAIVFASQVNSKWNAGDHAGALAASAKTKTWCFVALGSGLVVNLIAVVLQVFVLAAQS